MKFSHLIRIYTNNSLNENQILKIDNEYFHYLKSVIRLKKSSIFRIFNNKDGEFVARIEDIGKSFIIVKIESKFRAIKEERDLILAMCIIKQDRMMEAIRSAIQLGVTKIIPIISQRTQYKTVVREKIEKIIIQSTEQSERFRPAEILSETELGIFLQDPSIEQIIVALETESESKKISSLEKIKKNVAVLIGPEGGFSQHEIDMLRSYSHVETVSFGSTILRSETAATSALSCIQMIRT